MLAPTAAPASPNWRKSCVISAFRPSDTDRPKYRLARYFGRLVSHAGLPREDKGQPRAKRRPCRPPLAHTSWVNGGRHDPAAAEPGLFPIFLTLVGRPVVVVGDGAEAAAKVRLLARSGAVVRIVATAPGEDLRALIAAGQASLAGAVLTAAALDGARLCVVALDDAGQAAGAVVQARAAGVLANAVDRPELCDFIVPAIVDRAPVIVAIGTGGGAPALARDLRGRIEQVVPPGMAVLARLCRDWRARVAGALPDRAARRRFWDEVVAGPEAAAALD
ncbi:MAG: precorrin-2 dehydrogenase/sirohydrochlorin ferrochelatase family protein, partial [Acetobacteraceae bacterium]